MKIIAGLTSRALLALIVAAGLPGLVTSRADAQAYPARVVRIVVPFAAGGPVDLIARMLGQHMAQDLGQQVIVENRPGASGNIGAEVVVRSAPDGYTLLFSASTLIVNPYVMKERPAFDPLTDLTDIALIARGPLLFVVNAKTGATSVKDFVARAKAHPDQFNLATGGFGAAGHLAAEAFKLRAGLNIPVVLYKGTGPALTDVIGGQISGMMEPLLSTVPHVKAGQLRALAITSAKRHPLVPEVPTFAEAGFGTFEFYTWYGLWAPAKLPAPVAARLERAVQTVLAAPDMQHWFESQGLDISGDTGARFQAYIREESARMAKLVKDAHIEAK
jgi:tripartite-type tricarboxylate transporter receptor subunit TctC